MKSKYKGLIYCIFILIFLHVGQIWLYQKRVMANTLQQQKEKAFSEVAATIKTWIMGDSHPLLDVDPSFIPNAFNWAGTSENYVLNYFKINYLLAKYPKPREILLSAEYHGFSAQGMELLLQHELDDGYWASKIKADELALKLENSRPIRWQIAALWFPYAGQYYRGIKSWFQEEEKIGYRGWLPTDDVFDKNPQSAKILAEKIDSHAGKFKMIDSIQVHYFKKIISLCRQERIRLRVVRYPVHPQYVKELMQKTDLTPIDQIFNHFAGNIPVLDFRNIYDHQTQFFSDPDHLNAEGAKHFSSQLAHRIEEK